MARTCIVSVIIATVALSSPRGLTGAQPPPAQNPLESLEFLIGEWQGGSVESQGSSVAALESPRAHREFLRILGDRYIQIESHDMHTPEQRDRNPAPHDWIGIVSFDVARQKLVLRQFVTDGSVILYMAEPYAKGRRLVFSSEVVENLSPGAKARVTYDVIAPDELEEVVERADPDADFRIQSNSRVKRR